MKTTIFTSISRIINNVNKVFSIIERDYETSLTPVKFKRKFTLRFDKKIFLHKVMKDLYYHMSSKKNTRFVLKKTPSLKKRGKVVHFIVRVGVVGGAAKLIFDIINGLAYKYDMEAVVISDQNLENYPNLKIHYFSNPKDSIAYILKSRPDIVHTYYYGDWNGFHNHFESILKNKRNYSVIENLLVPIHIYRSDKVDEYVYVSKYIRDIQHRKFDNERVIYFGVDLEQFKPLRNKKFRNAVGMIYRLWNDKIDQSTIEMFIKLVKERPGTLVYIIGDGPNFHHYVERTRRESVRQNFMFTGTIDYSEVPSYYDKFDVFIAPVHTESYGIVVPYAMAKNMPVVAYRRGALPEIVGETNVLVNTSPEMIEVTKKILDESKYMKMISKGGRNRVRKMFSYKKMISDYDRLYEQLLSDKQREK